MKRLLLTLEFQTAVH